jgi:hypothetical protein
MVRKTSVAAAVIAFATVGSALFGGAALANGDDDHKDGEKHVVVYNTGGPGGAGGDVKQKCEQDATAFNYFYDSKKFDDVAQTATASNACTASSTGGAGGTGATY